MDASPWCNTLLPADADADGVVTQADADLVSSEIAASGVGYINVVQGSGSGSSIGSSPGGLPDATNDWVVNQSDVNFIATALAQASGSGSGSSSGGGSSTGTATGTGSGTGSSTGTGSGSGLFTIGNASVTEGGTLRFPVTYSGTGGATAYISTANSPTQPAAFAPSDYTNNSGSLYFSGPGMQYFDVSTNADDTVEWDELIEATVAGVATKGLGTIVNDDTSIVTFIALDSPEGSAASPGTLNFEVHLTNPIAIPIDIPWEVSTYNGGATWGVDWWADAHGTISPPNSNATTWTANLTTVIKGDSTIEQNEGLIMKFKPAVVTGVAGGYMVGTNPAPRVVVDQNPIGCSILNDDVGTITVTSVAKTVGEDVGTVDINIVFNGVSEIGAFTVDCTTSSNTASSGDGDYSSLAGAAQHIQFAGTNGEVKHATVTIHNDNKVEADEDFFVTLNGITMNWPAPDGSIVISPTGNQTQVFITDNDTAVLSIQDSGVVWEDGENGTLGSQDVVFHILLTNPVDVPITITVQLMSNGSAGFVFGGNAGADILELSGTVWTYQIPANTTDWTLTCHTVADATTGEGIETFKMCIMSMSFGTGITRSVTAGDWTAIGSIRSNE